MTYVTYLIAALDLIYFFAVLRCGDTSHGARPVFLGVAIQVMALDL